MSHTLLELFSYSVGIGALIGLVRIHKMDRAYLPFIILLCTAIINEVITTMIIDRGGSNAINNNIYVLLESLLIAWQFHNWKAFEHRPSMFWIIVSLFSGAWLLDNFWLSSITRFSSYFGILYSFVVVLMSIHTVNRVLLTSEGKLVKNAQFLICIGFIIFFSYKTLIELFWLYGLNESSIFRKKVYRIMTYINLAVNLLYAYAVLWIPTKRKYILH